MKPVNRLLIITAWLILPFSSLANDGADTSGMQEIVNFYNPANNFVYQPEAGVRPSEHPMRAGLLYDLENNKIVWQKEMNTAYPIASLTKMMVALITVEDIRTGKITWADNVKWTRELRMGRGKRKRIIREEVNYSLLDVFKAAMIASNNEAAEQMARYVGGNVQSFVDRMNTRARELGMNSTYYGNPTGLPASARTFDNSSTPTDLLVLTLEMLKYDEIMQVTGMGYADIHNGKYSSVIRNHNHLTIDYKGEVDGMKTGYTRRAGFCLVATSNKCNQRLISVVLGAHSPAQRNDAVKDMINDYYSALGLDKLGPYCESPSAVNNAAPGDPLYVTKYIKQTHVVKRGEDLGSIAYHYNCSATDLKKWNKLRSGKIAPGRKLVVMSAVREKIPVGDEIEEGTEDELLSSNNQTVEVQPEEAEKVVTTQQKPAPKVSAPTAESKSKYIIHVVQPGDTLFSIAKRYDVGSIAQLKAVNRISKSRLLKIGSRIKVPVTG